MRISLRWLREYVDVHSEAGELARRLTAAGLEVSEVEELGAEWEHIYVGEITSLEPHPQADRLQVARVSRGTEAYTVVTGAPNLRVGAKVPLALPGARVRHPETDELVPVTARVLRGISSEAVLCSERELGYSEDHSGIMLLPEDAPLGAPLREYLGDTLLEVEPTPNRPDWLSVLGVAWEVGALLDKPVRLPAVSYEETGQPIEAETSVEIADPDLCPRYTCTVVRGVRVGPSPVWLQQRLIAAGMRPINNVVDITNYVMLEYGQPLHAFDLDTLRGRRIVVRRARPDERIVTLDGEERALSPEMLVIADAERPVALAGIMGGAETEVTPATQTVLLESASFYPASIRRTSRALGMRTEASIRFEKGLSEELPVQALRRATQLLALYADGRPAPGILDVYPARQPRAAVALRPERVNRFLGAELSAETMRSVLSRLGFRVEDTGATLQVEVPFWRSDIEGEADLIEEIARVIGYDALPEELLARQLPALEEEGLWAFKEELRDRMAALGFQETITYTLISRRDLALVARGTTAQDETSRPTLAGAGGQDQLRVVNPLSPEQEYLRPSLRVGVLRTLEANQRREPDAELRLFELGRVYRPRPEGEQSGAAVLPEEREMLVAVLSGPRGGRSWYGGRERLDFYDAKGSVEALLEGLGLAAHFEPAADPLLSPGRTARIVVGERLVGWIGELHPLVAEELDLTAHPVLLWELDVEALAALPGRKVYRPVPRYPAVIQDISLLVPRSVAAAQVEALLRQHPLVTGVTLFDVYSGDPVPSGYVSLAYTISFQSPERTLTEEEVNRARTELVQRLDRELGVRLR